MSTRCNVLLRSPEGSAIWFYRHCDGYPSEAGRDLERLYTSHIVKSEPGTRGFSWIADFAERMVRACDETGDRIWRLTAGPHGDIEYCYVFDFPGFEDDASSVVDYRANVDRLAIRWAGGGYGSGVVERAQAQHPLTPDGFRKSLYREGADEYIDSNGKEKRK